MIRSPGSSAAPWAARNDRTNATVVAGSSLSPPSATVSSPLVTATRTAQGSTPGTSPPKTTPRWKTLPARIGSRSSKGRSRSTSSSAGARPRHLAAIAHPDGHLDLDGGRGPATHGHGGTVGGHPRVGQVPDDGLAQPEVLLHGGPVEADLPAHRRRAAGDLGGPARQEKTHAPGEGGGRVLVRHKEESRACGGQKVGRRSGRSAPVVRVARRHRSGVTGAAGRPERNPGRSEAGEEPGEENAASRMEDRRRVGPAFAIESKRHAGVVREPYRPHECRRANKWLRSRSASSSRGVRPTGSTTSRSSRAGGPGTPRTSTSPGRSTPTASTCPLLGAAMDGVISPATAIELGKLGGLGVLNLEGLWTRYEDPTPLFDEIRELDDDKATARMQQMYQEPIIPELVTARIRQMKEAGITTAASVTPQRTESLAQAILAAELDLLVIQGTVVSAEHVSKTSEPLNLKRFIREFDIPVIVGGCASYQAGLHLMRTGAVGVLVGVGPGNACTTRGVLGLGVPQATAIADVAGARMRHLDETGVYVHVIADGGMSKGGDVAKAIACGADAVMLGSPLSSAVEAPARGFHWGMATFHPTLPRGRPGAHVGAGEPARDPLRPRPRERRPHEPVRRTQDRDGDLRLRDGQGVPEGRGHGRPVPADRGEVLPAVPGRRHGPLSPMSTRPMRTPR